MHRWTLGGRFIAIGSNMLQSPGFSLPPAGLTNLHDHTLIVSELFALFSLGVSGSSCVRSTDVSRDGAEEPSRRQYLFSGAAVDFEHFKVRRENLCAAINSLRLDENQKNSLGSSTGSMTKPPSLNDKSCTSHHPGEKWTRQLSSTDWSLP